MRAGDALTWPKSKGANYYNVQLFRGGHKVLTAWPVTPRFKLPHAWTFSGHRETLARGTYKWYVWPGHGARAAARYGRCSSAARSVGSLTLRNRVTPLSELIADPARGLVYGNRGCLHDDTGRSAGATTASGGSPAGSRSAAGCAGRCCSPAASPSSSSSTTQRRSQRAIAHVRSAGVRTTSASARRGARVHPAARAPTRSTSNCTPSESRPGRARSCTTTLASESSPTARSSCSTASRGSSPASACGAGRPPGYTDWQRRRPVATVLVTPPSLVAVLAGGWRPEAVPFLHPSSLDSDAQNGTVPRMADVAKILAEKGGDVIRIGGEATVFDAIKAMVEANVGAILVTGADADRVEGIFTERDYLRRIAVEGRTSHETHVREVMTSP